MACCGGEALECIELPPKPSTLPRALAERAMQEVVVLRDGRVQLVEVRLQRAEARDGGARQRHGFGRKCAQHPTHHSHASTTRDRAQPLGADLRDHAHTTADAH
mgnify:CR=1 FL=1